MPVKQCCCLQLITSVACKRLCAEHLFNLPSSSLLEKLLLIINSPPCVIQDVHVILSSVEKTLRFLMKKFQDFSPYNGLQWKPNDSRSKRHFQYKLQTVQSALNNSRKINKALIKGNYRTFNK